ncbi:MAG: orotidine-5'-phosphate decarboxylase, partial [Planctomycetia bacterium]|nr:orotidine-5'-phosphate decarboxylase [Planctomycetia bacterium]
MKSFADRLTEAVKAKKTPVLVGLDPRWEQLPEKMTAGRDVNSGREVAEVFEAFCREIIDVVAPLVPAVKPQAAFFEQYGPEGMCCLARVIRYASSKGLLVVFDGKRNDIGSTATAYAKGILGRGSDRYWEADALTVNPYLGDDSLEPFVQVANDGGAGIFVLVKTSNPGGAMFQDLVADGEPIYRHVGKYVESLAATSQQRN